MRTTIGYVEHVDLPEFRVFELPAKVDTGALTSALHVENLCEWEDGCVTFDILLDAGPGARRRNVQAELSRHGKVRSTSGKIESRLFVTTTLRIGVVERRIELGLVDRAKMNYRMLLGRRALTGLFIVDPQRRYVLR
jgi:hypothetical protein